VEWLLRHPVLAIVAGVLLLALTTALIALYLLTRPAPGPPETFDPWYPLVNDDGDLAVADFENHVPCAIDDPPATDCQRVKFAIVLYRDDSTGEPTTYLVSIVRVGVSDARETLEGTWSVGQGMGLDPDATTYRLDSGAPEHLQNYWPVGEDILFLLDEDDMPRVGDAAYGFALNRIPIGQTNTVPAG
jgi:hypothetical protein